MRRVGHGPTCPASADPSIRDRVQISGQDSDFMSREADVSEVESGAESGIDTLSVSCYGFVLLPGCGQMLMGRGFRGKMSHRRSSIGGLSRGFVG